MIDIKKTRSNIEKSREINSYWRAIKKPVRNNTFLLEAGQGKNVNGNIFALLRYIRNDANYRDYEVYLSIAPGMANAAEEKLQYYSIENVKFVERDSLEYKEILATAKYLITDNSFPAYLYKRPEQIYVNTWHGTPLKALGKSDLDNATSLANVQANMLKADYLLHPNQYTKNIMMSDYMVDRLFKNKTVVMDYPRNDALYTESYREEILDRYQLRGKKLIAYMPTWRGTGRVANIAEQIDDVRAVLEGITAELKEDELLCVNLHFLIGNNIDISKYRNTMLFPSEYETYDFLAVCDTLITDYSSVCIDFAQTGKEVILHMYDYEEYKSSKGFYFDIRTLPFKQTYTADELNKAIHSPANEYTLDDMYSCKTRGNCCKALIDLMVSGHVDGLDIEDYNKPNDTNLVYVEDIVHSQSNALLGLYIESLTEEEKTKTVIAFENRINDEVVAIIKRLDSQIDVIRIEHETFKALPDAIATYLFNRYSVCKKNADNFYNRECHRLIDILNVGQITVLQLKNLDRAFALAKSEAHTCCYEYPTYCYGKNGILLNKRPEFYKSLLQSFDETKKISNKTLLSTWKDSLTYGVDAYLSSASFRSVGKNLIITGNITVCTEMDFEIHNKVVVCDREYDLNLTNVHSSFSGTVKTIKANMSIAIPLLDMESFIKENRFLLTLKSDDGDLKTLLKFNNNRNKFKVVKIELGDPDLDCYIKYNKIFVVLEIRPSNYTDALSERIKLYLGWAISHLTPWDKPILLFEKESSRYEESAAAVYEKLIDMGSKNVFFILDRNYEHWNRIPKKYRKNLIKRFSFKHYYHLFAAKSFISSEMLSHSLELNSSSKVFIDNVVNGAKNYVFLQHGVMYMVSLSSESRGFFRKKPKTGIQRVVVSSQLEAKHFTDYTPYRDEDLYISGLPKFDKSILEEGADLITVMLTWRPWEYISAVKEFEQTKYYKMLARIITAIPEKYHDRIVVLPHPRVAELADANSNEGVWRYSVTGVKYDDVLGKTKVLITDYSSISYDAFYRGSNVLFCWGEKDECMQAYGADTKLMLTEDLAFGPISYDENIGKLVEQLYENGQEEKYIENYRKIVEFHDGHNTDRVLAMMKKDKII